MSNVPHLYREEASKDQGAMSPPEIKCRSPIQEDDSRYSGSFACHRERYDSQTVHVVVPADIGHTSVNFTLLRRNPENWADHNDYNLEQNLFSEQYLNNNELNMALNKLDMENPAVAQFLANDSPTSAAIQLLKITDQIGSSDEKKLKIALVGGLYASHPIGRELLLRFARHLVTGFVMKDLQIVKILSNTVIYIIPGIDSAFVPQHDEICYKNIAAFEAGILFGASKNNTISNALSGILTEKEVDLILNIVGGGWFSSVLKADQLHDKMLSMLSGIFEKTFNSSDTYHCDVHPDLMQMDNMLLQHVYGKFGIPMISVHIGCCSYPHARDIAQLWRTSLQPLKEFIKATQQGIEGTVKNANDQPLRNAVILIDSSYAITVTSNMAYFRTVLSSGTYNVKVSCPGYDPKKMEIGIQEGHLLKMNVVLEPVQHLSYHSPQDLKKALLHQNSEYSRITNINFIAGDSNGEIMDFVITDQNHKEQMLGYPAIGFFANIDGIDPITSEILLQMTADLLKLYNQDDTTQYLKDKTMHMLFGSITSNETTSKEFTRFSSLGKWLDQTGLVLFIMLRAGAVHIESPHIDDRDILKNFSSPDKQVFSELMRDYITHQSSMLYKSEKCTNVSNIQTAAKSNKNIHSQYNNLMEYVYQNKSAFPLCIYVDCDRNPEPYRLTTIWKRHKESLFHILSWVTQGITGYVTDDNNRPIASAAITVKGSTHVVKSSMTGAYWRLLPSGHHTVTVSAQYHLPTTKVVNVVKGEKPTYVMFRLARDETVLGMPRLVFIMVAGCVCLIMILLGICCYSACKTKKKRNYDFSLLSQKTEISEDGSEMKKELSGHSEVTTPYFDEDSDSEDEIVLINTGK